MNRGLASAIRGLVFFALGGFTTVSVANATPLASNTRNIQIHGIEIEVDKVEFFPGTTIISNLEISKPTTLPFARNNVFEASHSIYLHRQGNVSLIFSVANPDLNWLMPNGQTLNLNCSLRPATFDLPARPRVIAFHENREYYRGCELKSPTLFKNAAGAFEIIANDGDIDLNANGDLEYASHLQSGKLRLNNQDVELKAGSSVALYESGLPRFFTMNSDASFSSRQGLLGEIRWNQSVANPVSTSLFPGGEVERGILGQELPISFLGENAPIGTGLFFETPELISALIFPSPRVFRSVEAVFRYQQVRNNPLAQRLEYVTLDSFLFTIPESGKILNIPVGAVISVSPDQQIVEIQSPSPR